MEYTLDHNIKGIEEKYGIKVSFSGVDMDGTALTLHDLLVKQSEEDTLLYTHKITGLVSKRSLLSGGKVKLKKLEAETILLRYQREIQDSANIKFIDSSPNKENKSYAEKVRYAVGFVSRMLPGDISLKDMNLEVALSDSLKGKFIAEEFIVKDGTYSSDFTFIELKIADEITRQNDSLPQKLHTEGKYDRETHFFSTLLYSAENSEIKIPYILDKLGAEISADSIKAWCGVRFEGERGEESLRINCSIKSDALGMYHRLVSDRKLNLGDLDISLHTLVNKNKIEVDSSTTVTMGKFYFSPYLSVQKDTSTKVTFEINKERFKANDFFSSIPDGLMPTISGIEVEGDVSYNLFLSFDTHNIDSLKFKVNAKKYPDFKIKKFGKINLSYPNDTFTYNAYLDGKLMRQISINEQNKGFLKYKDIPEEVIASILFSEDPSFFKHKGFLESATRESIIKNLKEKRFARGGSTLSMQLVKNLFLNQNKNLMRKVEEAILVWLIEQNNIISKERMMEIYVNIIEWGPNVYGLNEAAKYYFDKSPGRLNTEEAIYLAMIIPRPRKFMYCFDNSGHLRDSYEQHFTRIKTRLFDSNLVRDTSKVQLKDVKLSGEARTKLKIDIEENNNEFSEKKKGVFQFFKRLRKND